MAIIKSGVSTDVLTIDPTSKAARATLYDASGNVIGLATSAKQDTANTSLAAIQSSLAGGFSPTDGTKATYAATVNALTTAASATNIVTINGSASKTVRVVKVLLSGIQTASGNMTVLLRKQSTADSGGTPSSVTAVPHDSTSAAASATVNSYTGAPSAGSLVGVVVCKRVTFPSAATAFDSPLDFFIADIPAQAIVLRGVAQGLAISFNGVTLTGGSVNATICWTEE